MNGFFWTLAIIYIVLYFVFIFRITKLEHSTKLVGVSLLVLLPPLFYGFAYFIVFSGQKDYIKELSEIWGPFWAASSALLLVVYSDP